jgi:lipopolysaccharide export system protein LptC
LTLSPAIGDGPSPASVLARRQARAHSRLVMVLRWLLPTLILALLGLLGAFVIGEALKTAASRPKETPTQIRMIGPHFLGRDDLGRAFNLASRLAIRDDVDMQRVYLTAPVIVLDVDGPRPKTLTADRGVYDEDTHMLRLSGHVRLDDSQASTVSTSDALVDTRAGTVTGVSSITGRGPTGVIQGHSYTAYDKGKRVVLRGGVHAVLNGH